MRQDLSHSRHPLHRAWIAPAVAVAFIGSVIAVGLMSTVGPDRLLEAVRPAHPGGQPPPVTAAAGPTRLEPLAGTGVPDAAGLFRGRDTLVEESSPTF